MENIIINFRENRNSFEDIKDIESICLKGNPDIFPNAKITICIPTYKRSDLLKRAIDSALSQKTEIPFLVFVVDNEDDFSETETFKLIQSYHDNRLVYYKNKKNLGMGGNWNRCGELVKTKYFSLLHDDDELLPFYINTVYKYLEKNKYDFIFLAYEQYENPFLRKNNENSEKHNKVKYLIKNLLYREKININLSDNLFLDNVFGAPTCGVLIKKSIFLSSGGFNMKYYPALDWFYFIYALNNFKCIKLNINCGIYYWEQNASLKEDVLNGFKKQRELVINSLSKTNFGCKLYFTIFRNDFITKINTRLETPIDDYSLFYKLVLRIKQLKYMVKNNG